MNETKAVVAVKAPTVVKRRIVLEERESDQWFASFEGPVEELHIGDVNRATLALRYGWQEFDRARRIARGLAEETKSA